MDFLPLQTAAFGTILSAPLLRVQAILQTQDVIPTLRFSKQMKGAFNCIGRIQREEGTRFLWRGGAPLFIVNLLRPVFDIVQSTISQNQGIVIKKNQTEIKPDETIGQTTDNNEKGKQSSNITDTLLSDSNIQLAALTLVRTLVIHPVELLYIRLACDYGTQKRQFSGMMHAAKTLMKAGGIKALYRGYIPNATVFIAQRNISAYWIEEKGNEPLELAKVFARDAALYPLVVLSTRLMMIPHNPLVKYGGLVDCVKKTYKEFGIGGFYKGFQINLFTYTLSCLSVLYQKGYKGF